MSDPYFTMKRKEWDGMSPKGRAALAEMARAAVAHFSKCTCRNIGGNLVDKDCPIHQSKQQKGGAS